jgi:hypothetical protein
MSTSTKLAMALSQFKLYSSLVFEEYPRELEQLASLLRLGPDPAAKQLLLMRKLYVELVIDVCKDLMTTETKNMAASSVRLRSFQHEGQRAHREEGEYAEYLLAECAKWKAIADTEGITDSRERTLTLVRITKEAGERTLGHMQSMCDMEASFATVSGLHDCSRLLQLSIAFREAHSLIMKRRNEALRDSVVQDLILLFYELADRIFPISATRELTERLRIIVSEGARGLCEADARNNADKWARDLDRFLPYGQWSFACIHHLQVQTSLAVLHERHAQQATSNSTSQYLSGALNESVMMEEAIHSVTTDSVLDDVNMRIHRIKKCIVGM